MRARVHIYRTTRLLNGDLGFYGAGLLLIARFFEQSKHIAFVVLNAGLVERIYA